MTPSRYLSPLLKRPWWLLSGALLLFAVPRPAQASCAAPANPIEAENCLPGNFQDEWDSYKPTDDMVGFATQMSVNVGETVSFKIRSTAPTYRLDIFRLGWYGGKGARRVASLSGTKQNQPACLTDVPTKLIDCGNWQESLQWQVPANAVSGIYLGKMVGDNGSENLLLFVVRNDASTAPLLFKTNDANWQAYNRWGGASLYFPRSRRGYKVSYNRPFVIRGFTNSTIFNHQYPMLRWLERNGYDMTYMSDVDLQSKPDFFRGRRVVMSVGHDEYYSMDMRNNLRAARDAGVHLALLTGNQIYWKSRWEPSIDGTNTPDRTMVCYKEQPTGRIDPKDPPIWTGLWQASPPGAKSDVGSGLPANELSGVLARTFPYQTEPLSVRAEEGRLRFWRNTSAASLPDGGIVTFPDLIGYEWDTDADNDFRPLSLFRVSYSSIGVRNDRLEYRSVPNRIQAMTVYKADSGALVWGAGTMQWSWGLDRFHSAVTGQTTPIQRDVQQATVNMLADMTLQPASMQTDLVAASASTDTQAPTCFITSPASKRVRSGVRVSIRGNAADSGGGRVAGIIVSVDGGKTWRRATGRDIWVYTVTPTADGEAQCRAVDDSGNLQGRQITPPVQQPPTQQPPTQQPPTQQPPQGLPNPAPSLMQLEPRSARPGQTTFQLGVRGSGFVSGSVVRWNGADRPTTFVSSTYLRAAIPASDMTTEQTVPVTVFTPAPGGGISPAIDFVIYESASLGGKPRVFPNPWRANVADHPPYVTFDTLAPQSEIEIFTLSGHFVRWLLAADGTARWDLRNDAGQNVASGYYLATMTDEDGKKTRERIAVLR